MGSKRKKKKKVRRRVEVYIEGSETDSETPRKTHIEKVGVPERSVLAQPSRYQPYY